MRCMFEICATSLGNLSGHRVLDFAQKTPGCEAQLLPSLCEKWSGCGLEGLQVGVDTMVALFWDSLSHPQGRVGY